MDKIKEIVEWIICIIVALILALLIRYFLLTPTVVMHSSMYPTLKEGERLILDRTFRITKKEPEVGDIITFEAPVKVYSEDDADQTNPIAIYNNKQQSLAEKFLYYGIEITKISYIKRVIAVEGDHVVIENGKVYVNDKLLEEKYLSNSVETNSSIFYDFIVPKDYIFAMGDNRENSIDCRHIGCIPLNKLEGIVICRFWPLKEMNKF